MQRPSTTPWAGWRWIRAVSTLASRSRGGELAVFEESNQPIDFVAHGDTSFVLGSAVKHPHDLVMGHYSVHTSKAALEQGEAEIQRIGARLRSGGRLQGAKRAA